MKRKNWPSLRVTLLLTYNLACVAVCGAAEPYHLLTEIPAGGEENWSLPAIDSTTRRLYLPRESHVSIIDLDKGLQVGEITNTPGICSFAICPPTPYGCFCSKSESMMKVVNLTSYGITAKAVAGPDPVAVAFNTSLTEVYAFSAGDNSARMYEADDGDFMGTISLPGKPVSAVYDAEATTFFCSIGDKNGIAAVDTKTHTVTNFWPTSPGEAPSILALDSERKRLFIGCGNNLLVMMDISNGKVVATVPIGAGVDATAFDPDGQFVFSSCRDGTVTITHEESPDKLTVIQTIKTDPGSRTLVLDPKTHNIYIPTAKVDGASKQLSGKSSKIAPGSFKILVYAREHSE